MTSAPQGGPYRVLTEALVSRDEAESKPGSEFAKAYPNQVIAARLVQRYDAVAQAREPELDHVTLSATEPRGALPLQEWSLVAIPDKGEAMRAIKAATHTPP